MSTALGSGTGEANTAPGTGNPNVSDGGSKGESGDKSGGDKSALGGGAGDNKSWRDSLPEELKSHAAVVNFKDLESFTKSYIHAQGLIGKKGVFVPGEKATQDQWKDFYKSLGVPETVDKYNVTTPEGVNLDAKVLTAFKETALKAGVLPKQANELLGWYTKFEKDQAIEFKTQQDAKTTVELDGLKKDWGDAYTKKLNEAKFAVKELGGDDLVNYMDKSGMGNDVRLIKLFAEKIAPLLGEDKLREGTPASDAQTMAEIDDQLAIVRGQLLKMDTKDLGRPAILRQMESLAKRKTGGK